MWHLTLYGKPDCPLCDEAKAAIHEFAQECELELKWVDISQDPELWNKYQFEIPVLWIEGQEAARHHLGVKKLRVLRKRWEEGKDLQIHQTGTGLFPKV
ncbi:MAG: glutaredoxin family protein [Planctomycetes bacterium]|nr:glutaredoxin family protein [Planctomycetota bacterium]